MDGAPGLETNDVYYYTYTFYNINIVYTYIQYYIYIYRRIDRTQSEGRVRSATSVVVWAQSSSAGRREGRRAERKRASFY